ncbi:MAG: hypothetical protein ACYCO0_00535 [Candidatus Micrarchaeaceae archaeon]
MFYMHRHRHWKPSPVRDTFKFVEIKDAIGKGDCVILRDAAILNGNTRTKGQYESALKQILLERDILAWYEPVIFKIPSARGGTSYRDTYPPDFFTTFFVDGKQVIIELHNADTAYFERMGRFRETYGDRFYYILIKSNLENSEKAYVQMGAGVGGKKDVDEFWHLPRIHETNRGNYNKNDCGRWQALVGELLSEFVARRADGREDKKVDFEKVAALINVKRAA